ncbi:uncharacterized protein LOC114933907 [Nylanderia fulva]|uniref:uncharacterized protein LOC114933907 n=1 Tax=Nylanderia fulva TaxID=613905 RepID=UPI0010FAF1D5|nr:uncharacterized protein LOC114933907 [Nylanderia fulva]
MADSSYEKGLTELSKMKVADLRIELKQRGLSSVGNKNELVERLQLAIQGDSALSLDETTEEILDEDEVLGDEEIEELSSKPDSQVLPEKRKLSVESNNTNAKKIVLNRKPVLEEIKNDQVEKNENKTVKESDDAPPEKKIIKLSELSTKERLEMRAKKFGMPLTEAAKKEARLARFNINNQNNKSAASIKTPVNTTYETLKKRGERFGTSVSSVMEKAELAERLEKRKARFGEVQPNESKVSYNKVKICIDMELFKLLIYVVSSLYALSSNVYCDETDAFDDVTPPIHELKNIHHFFYKSEEKDLSSLAMQAKRSDQSALAQSCSCKELDEQNTQGAVFYKRLIAILLSNLAMQKVDDKLIGTINVEASLSQLEYLKNFINGQGSIREVDRILDNVIKQQSDYSMCYHMAEISHYCHLLLKYLMNYLLIMKDHWDITIIFLIIVFSFMMLMRRQRWSGGLIMFLLIEIIFIISFFITWWRLIQEAEIKLMAAQAQFAEMPIACQPHKMGLWHKIYASIFASNECEKYYESIMTNPRLQVTPAYALTYFLSTVIFQPFSYFGLVMSEFIDNATSKLNFVSKTTITFVLFLTFCICIILLPFSLIGGSINFGVGPFFKFGIKGKENNSNKKQERIERIYEVTSPKKRLNDSEMMEQITWEQQDKDPAGGDAGIGIHHPSEKHIKCKCKNKNVDESIKCKKREERDDTIVNDC